MLRSWLAFVLITLSYGATLLAARVLRRLRRPARPIARIVAVGTFHNPNWFRSHAAPLARSGAEGVRFVVDAAQPEVECVSFVTPARWLRRVAGRALSKLFTLVSLGRRWSADLFIGYHIFPGALTALLAARLCGRAACYQMTGGPIEVMDGGAHSENPVLASLRPSGFLERLALRVVSEFDLVVVRGEKARAFLAEHGIREPVRVIPGSVDPRRFALDAERVYDLVFMGRLTELKQPLQFVDIVAGLVAARPHLRAAVVGDGPLAAAMRRRLSELGVAGRVEMLGQSDRVEEILQRARVFVLTSRSEGLSIAMAEAMYAGCVPVVADVGELGDLVRHGQSGFLAVPDDIASYVACCGEALDNAARWQDLSRAARDAARRYNDVDAVAARWKAAREWLAAGMPAHTPREAHA